MIDATNFETYKWETYKTKEEVENRALFLSRHKEELGVKVHVWYSFMFGWRFNNWEYDAKNDKYIFKIHIRCTEEEKQALCEIHRRNATDDMSEEERLYAAGILEKREKALKVKMERDGDTR